MTLELILVGVVRRRGAGVIRDGLWRSGEAGIVIFIIRRTRARAQASFALALISRARKWATKAINAICGKNGDHFMLFWCQKHFELTNDHLSCLF